MRIIFVKILLALAVIVAAAALIIQIWSRDFETTAEPQLRVGGRPIYQK